MIRAIREDDIPCCVEIICKSFSTVANEFGFTEENAPRFTAFATTEERLRWQLNNEHRLMYVFVENDTIIGYYSLLIQDNQECELNNLCVLPQYRHKQVGKELLENAFINAKKLGCKKLNIGIVEENQILRKWYEKYGFIHIRTEKFDFFPFTCGYMVKSLYSSNFQFVEMKQIYKNRIKENVMQKYVRIQGRELAYRTQYPKGIFSICWRMIMDGIVTEEEKEEFEQINNWFKENLIEPEPCKNGEKVITFFKTETTEHMLKKLEPAIKMLDRYQHPYDIVYTNYVGKIVYEDEYQIAVSVE